MTSNDKKLLILRAKEKELLEVLKKDSKALVKTWTQLSQKVGLGLTVGTLVYGVAYTLLRKREKVQQNSQSKTHILTSSTNKSLGWFLKLLTSLLSLGFPKSQTPYLQNLLSSITRKKSNLFLSVLVAILPWLLRFLFGAYGQGRSRTSS